MKFKKGDVIICTKSDYSFLFTKGMYFTVVLNSVNRTSIEAVNQVLYELSTIEHKDILEFTLATELNKALF
jgi:hypothetical protein